MANDLQLRLNPALDVEAYAAVYRRDRPVQIPDVFEPEVAAAISWAVRAHRPLPPGPRWRRRFARCWCGTRPGGWCTAPRPARPT